MDEDVLVYQLKSSTTLTVAAAASDFEGVARVIFLVDGTPAFTDLTTPFSAALTHLVPGTHLLTARAYDTAGNNVLAPSGTAAPAPASSLLDPPAPPESLDSFRAYPDPFRPGHGASGVTFDQIPEGSEIRLFTMDGRPVKTLVANSSDFAVWDLTSDGGNLVASNVYVAGIEKNNARKRVKVVVQK